MPFILHYRLFKGLIASAERRNGPRAADEATKDLIDAAIAAAVHRFGADRAAIIVEQALSNVTSTGDDV